MIKKKIAALLFLSCIVMMSLPAVSLATTTSAVEQQEKMTMVQPRLTYIADAAAGLSINGTTATVDCWVNGDVLDATKAKVIAELQLKSGNNWIAYGTWVDTQNDYEAYVYETKAVKKGNTYRVKATVTVWEGSASESLILFSDEITA